MKPEEMIRKIQESSPEALQGISPDQAKALVTKVLALMRATVSKAADGNVRFPGFGVIRIKKVEKEVDGKKVVKKRMRFKPAGGMARMAKQKRRERPGGAKSA